MSFLDLYLSRNPMITASWGPASGGGGAGGPVSTILGIPFDSTHSYRPGCRFGPDAIRGAFNNIEVFHPGLGVDLEDAAIEDLGNLTQTVVAEDMVEMVRRVAGELLAGGGRRQLIFLGGEHSVTYATYTSFPPGTGYVVFDAHYDLREQYAGTRLSHASYLRRIVEGQDGRADNIVHVGARAFAPEELAFLREHGVRTVSDRDIRDGRGPGLVADAVSSFDSTYASFDLDVLDPAFAPGVGNPEAEGITSRELFDMVRAAGEKTRVAGADIVEMNPGYDTGATAALAARIVSVLVAMGAG